MVGKCVDIFTKCVDIGLNNLIGKSIDHNCIPENQKFAIECAPTYCITA